MKKYYIRISDKCNLHCRHCYARNQYDQTKIQYVDPVQVINWIDKDITKDILARKAKNLEPNVYVISFHGGEPFVDARSCDLVEFISDSFMNAKYKDQLQFDATTNLLVGYNTDNTPLTRLKVFLDNPYFYYENRPFLKISWDYGDLRFNELTEKLWWDNVESLKAMYPNIYLKVNICLTKQLVKSDFLTKDWKRFEEIFTEVHFEKLTKNTTLDKSVIPLYKDIDKFLVALYKMKPKIRVDNFEAIISAIDGKFLGCAERCCTEIVRTINADGSVSSCPNTFMTTFDHIDPMKAKEIQHNNKPKYDSLVYKEKFDRYYACYICPLFKICNGGCFQLQSDEEGHCSGDKELMMEILLDRASSKIKEAN